MALGVDKAIALLLAVGDPIRGISGLTALFGYDFSETDASGEIYIGEEPPSPDGVVTVVLDAGGPPIPGAFGQGLLRQPGWSVRSRAATYQLAQEVAHSVMAILDEFEGTSNSVPFFRINANFEPIPLGRDLDGAGGRWVFTQSFRSLTKRFALA